MKSTQDLLIFLNQLEQALEIPVTGKLLSIEVFADKTFRINQHNGQSVEILYDSEEVILPSGAPQVDFNDLCYKDPDVLAEEIKESKAGKQSDELDLH